MADSRASQPGLKGWIDHRLPVFTFMNHELNEYPTPRNLSYWWNFGSLAGIILVIMIISGIVLAMNYTAHADYAFESVERIMRDVPGGWLVRYIHMNGASMFFAVVYIHMFRGLFYGSYKAPREILWMLGVLILLLMMATAFMGYVLPWGQMSLWGAEVITNFFNAIPFVGETLVQWLRGGFTVDNPTLTRFFALHYLMPFVIVGVVVLHLVALHQHGSNNPLGIDLKDKKEKIPFHPYYTIKDMFGLGVFLLVYMGFVFYAPNYLGHPDNYIPADPMVTPPHIVPEWYFLPFYAVLRAVTFNTPLLWLAIAGGAGLVASGVMRGGFKTFQLLPFVLAAGGVLVAIVGIALAAGSVGIDLAVGPVIDSRLGGVLAMGGAVVILFFLPWLDTHPVRSGTFRPVYKWAFRLFMVDCLVLGYIGAIPAEGMAIVIGQIATAYYFAFFLLLMPLLSKHEKTRPLPQSINTPVLA